MLGDTMVRATRLRLCAEAGFEDGALHSLALVRNAASGKCRISMSQLNGMYI